MSDGDVEIDDDSALGCLSIIALVVLFGLLGLAFKFCIWCWR